MADIFDISSGELLDEASPPTEEVYIESAVDTVFKDAKEKGVRFAVLIGYTKDNELYTARINVGKTGALWLLEDYKLTLLQS